MRATATTFEPHGRAQPLRRGEAPQLRKAARPRSSLALGGGARTGASSGRAGAVAGAGLEPSTCNWLICWLSMVKPISSPTRTPSSTLFLAT